MEYKDRKVCGLINLHNILNELRCPQLSESKATRGTVCDGCELFETYLRLRSLSLELKDFEEAKN